jgi:hypothetical protein
VTIHPSEHGMMRRSLVSLLLVAPISIVAAQQVPDTLFRPTVGAPAYPTGRGPTVYIDEAHHNFHTMQGRFTAFARLAAADGYRVRRQTKPLTRAVLDSIRILVISNALPAQNETTWVLPIASAFTGAEVSAVRDWVRAGGSLLVIADHMPMAGAVEDLMEPYGIYPMNGFAFEVQNGTIARGPMILRRKDGTLAAGPIANGCAPAQRIDSVATFTGSAFRSDVPMQEVLIFPKRSVVLFPRVAWQFSDSTPAVAASGLSQGAVRRFGAGRVAMFGEAAMFTAQRTGPQGQGTMGFNAPIAKQNPQFVLNVLHWLSGAACMK